jgi:VPDSG-CTERM motif
VNPNDSSQFVQSDSRETYHKLLNANPLRIGRFLAFAASEVFTNVGFFGIQSAASFKRTGCVIRFHKTKTSLINSNKNMKNTLKMTLAGLAVGLLSCGLFSQQAQAAQISGDIQFAGEVQFDTNSLATATTVVTWFDVFHNAGFSNVTSATGDFAGIAPGTQASMPNSWIFNPSTATPGLWSVGGFTFDLLSATVVVQNAKTLSIEGTGIVSGNGFDPTAMDWSFTTQSAGGKTRTTFSFSGNGVTGVPDGGSAVALLGIALIGIEVLRRKLRIT